MTGKSLQVQWGRLVKIVLQQETNDQYVACSSSLPAAVSFLLCTKENVNVKTRCKYICHVQVYIAHLYPPGMGVKYRFQDMLVVHR